jgi:phosphoglycolate phosphatase-like HAD superfamily hydrolase
MESPKLCSGFSQTSEGYSACERLSDRFRRGRLSLVSYYHAVMFDFDGTLVDTMHKYADIAAEEMSASFNLPLRAARELYLETSGIPFFEQLRTIFGSSPRNDVCANKFEARKAKYLETVWLADETRRVLSELRTMGLSIAITSNNFQDLLDRFVAPDRNLFDLVLGFSGKYSKGPTQFGCVLDTFGVDRRHILFVGDSISDARKSLAFGIDFVAIAGTISREAFSLIFPSVAVLQDLDELVTILTHTGPVLGIDGVGA